MAESTKNRLQVFKNKGKDQEVGTFIGIFIYHKHWLFSTFNDKDIIAARSRMTTMIIFLSFY